MVASVVIASATRDPFSVQMNEQGDEKKKKMYCKCLVKEQFQDTFDGQLQECLIVLYPFPLLNGELTTSEVS